MFLVTGTVPASARRAWTIWAIGVAAYAVAVLQRSSLSVAGLLAQQRFHASASELSLFAVLQLAVYAGMQVPVGILLDRFGTRRLVTTGALVMAAGQVGLAFAHSVPAAVAARVLVGTGDAMTFISVLALVTAWFPPRQAPVVTQLTGILGQLGQIAAAYPLLAMLRSVGWTASFAGVGALSVLAAAMVRWQVVDAPPGVTAAMARHWADVRRELRLAWREPGTRMGLWTHFSTQFSGTVFGLLWGYPFLVSGEGVGRGTAGALLTLLVVVAMLVGPVFGRLAGGWPFRRSLLVIAIVGATAATWTTVLAWPGRAPMWLLVVLVVVLGTNGPGSMVGFDYARTENPAIRRGSASGIVNVGGFVASLSTILLIGIVLDAVEPGAGSAHSLGAFRAAFAVQYAMWILGLLGVLRSRYLLRKRLAERGIRLEHAAVAAARRLRTAREIRRQRSDGG